ncbi:MAG: bifunctional riboflavin kinase/FAD synthetase [Phyllobacteriaceae bacterium]|nr:bifunctional riboflavin kinase/FAD synthetase [Phyllobacteriaceae bacterium]
MKGIVRIGRTSALPGGMRRGVVAIGNFDGVHRGHRAVLNHALEIARDEDRPAIVLTFEPHPRAFFQPDRPIFRLTPAPLKARILEALGFESVVEQPFTAAFAELPAEHFVSAVLEHDLGVAHVVPGHDFHFGKGREGTPEFLAKAGARLGFDVLLVDAYRDEGGAIVSSSRVRDCIVDGDAAGAAGLLGYRYLVAAPVRQGQQLGRTLGYPTANMALPAETALRHGVYAVRLRRADGTLHDGVASFGRRPTVTEDGEPLLETFVFDASPDLYGETCTVSFFGFLRGEVKFDGFEALVAQMKRDEAEARALLAGVKPLSVLDATLNFG